eukprot:TRINITY_DN115644_c0_g1_i1.p1 TRINITY_DN115644_c0_g1~~TRINITY_DN115644_c0_g1_i1.p1  ORF type:complete len:483 (-),score=88.88 TRINITY_DN115644_c0_g1_i1:328-1776(-)
MARLKGARRPRNTTMRCAAAAVAFGILGAEAQLCRSSGGFREGAPCGGNVDVELPYAEAALWALSLIHSDCDSQGQQCNWYGLPDAWRYVLNNLRAAIANAEKKDQEWLPLEPVQQVQGFVDQLGQDPNMWYGNWQNAAPMAREFLEQLRPWLSSGVRTKASLPAANIATHFPTLGRSVVVSSSGDMGAAVTLANGFAMPVLGFGTWQIPADGTCYQSVKWALELGYRHIDTAQGYRNEHEVGRAIRDSGVPRSEICLVTKLSEPGEYPRARQRFEKQLETLGVDYLDVYMLHSPGGSKEDREKAWKQLEELYDEGKIKALGVSNFDVTLLQELFTFARIRPVYIQNKYSIYQPGSRDEALKDSSLMEWLQREKIVMTGYSTIHPGHGGYLSPLDDPHVKAIASRHGKTSSQVLHRWLVQLGAAVIPKSIKKERIRENGNIFDFALTEADMRLLNGIATLVKSDPGKKAPRWIDDVYGMESL